MISMSVLPPKSVVGFVSLLLLLLLLSSSYFDVVNCILISPDGKTTTFPQPVELLEMEYQVKGLNLQRRHQKQIDDIMKSIHDMLELNERNKKREKTSSEDDVTDEDLIYMSTSGGAFGGGPLPISGGYEYETRIAIHPKNEKELYYALQNKTRLREQLRLKVMDLFENNLMKKYKKLKWIVPPGKSYGMSYTLRLKKKEDSSSTSPPPPPPPPEERLINGKIFESKWFDDGNKDDPIEYADRLIGYEYYRILKKQKLASRLGGGMSSRGGYDDNNDQSSSSRQVHRCFKASNKDELQKIRNALKSAIEKVVSENDWLEVTIRDDLEE